MASRLQAGGDGLVDMAKNPLYTSSQYGDKTYMVVPVTSRSTEPEPLTSNPLYKPYQGNGGANVYATASQTLSDERADSMELTDNPLYKPFNGDQAPSTSRVGSNANNSAFQAGSGPKQRLPGRQPPKSAPSVDQVQTTAMILNPTYVGPSVQLSGDLYSDSSTDHLSTSPSTAINFSKHTKRARACRWLVAGIILLLILGLSLGLALRQPSKKSNAPQTPEESFQGEQSSTSARPGTAYSSWSTQGIEDTSSTDKLMVTTMAGSTASSSSGTMPSGTTATSATTTNSAIPTSAITTALDLATTTAPTLSTTTLTTEALSSSQTTTRQISGSTHPLIVCAANK
eukprot:m.3208 g.3208  ORF g.3208 m.3208 type:complete len:343 (-) comp4750_c0_seq2:57-1085(-)